MTVKHGVERIWKCKIGGTVEDYPRGADLPMREAVAAAFRKLTGRSPEFTFSGWGAELTEGERAVVENREPVAPVETGAVRLTPQGVSRVLDGVPGMTFVVDSFTNTADRRGLMAHVRDYRYLRGELGREFQVWSLAPGDYETVSGGEPSGPPPTDADALHANHASSPLGCESDATGTCSNSRRQPEDFRSLAGDERPASASPSEPPSAPTDWQPIETAPKDGTNIIAGVAGLARSTGEMFWVDDRWMTWDGENYKRTQAYPTHWMPIPQCPAQPPSAGYGPVRTPRGTFWKSTYAAFVNCLGVDPTIGAGPCSPDPVGLTPEQYEQQLSVPDKGWRCPKCGGDAVYNEGMSEVVQGVTSVEELVAETDTGVTPSPMGSK